MKWVLNKEVQRALKEYIERRSQDMVDTDTRIANQERVSKERYVVAGVRVGWQRHGSSQTLWCRCALSGSLCAQKTSGRRAREGASAAAPTDQGQITGRWWRGTVLLSLVELTTAVAV